MDVQSKRILVVGLARSGLAVARALARRGAVVTVTDNKPPGNFADVLPQLIKDKVGMELGSQRVETFLRHQMIVISPGVPWDLPQLEAARQKAIPIYPEVEAASWFLEGPLVGITGSNGKTTTTTLLGDMLKASGFPTFVGGNIGNALSSAVDHAEPGTKFVTELSSFQLEGIHSFRPHVAVMLNLSPNHLDRHPNLEAYANAKKQIFRNQGGQDFAVLNADDPWVAGLQTTVASRPVFFSRTQELPNGVFLSGGKIYYRVRHLERVLFETRDVPLRGDFNLEDVLAATAAACVLGADFAAIRKAVRDFKAVEHRLEFVREIKGVEFFNNSKATSVDATLKSLGAFERGVHLIIGGKDKGAPYAPLIPLIKERVRDVLLIGVAAPVIAQQLAGSAELLPAGDLETAVYEAFARSRPGDTVLLAPACSSFDQFHDYEERGRVFKDLVKQLALDVAAGRVGRPKLVPLAVSKSAAVEVPPATVVSEPVAAPLVPLVEASAAPAEAPTVQVEAVAAKVEPVISSPPAPGVEKTAAEKRAAARKRAREMASASTRKAEEATPALVAPMAPSAAPGAVEAAPAANSSTETIADATVAKVPAVGEQVDAASDAAELAPTVQIAIPVSELVPPAASEPVATAENAAEVGTLASAETAPEADASPVKKELMDSAQTVSMAEPVTVKVEAPRLAESTPVAEPAKVEADVAGSAEPAPVVEPAPAQISSPAKRDEAPAIRKRVSAAGERKSNSTVAPGKGSAQSIPHRVELSYVYEVAAVDLPGMDSQVEPDDEPVISLSGAQTEVLDDEVMPFEARKKADVQRTKSEVREPRSEVRGPKSEVNKTKSEGGKNQTGAPSDTQQPKLFNGNDD